MKKLLICILLIPSLSTLACNDLNGEYKSVSETHWSLNIKISDGNVKLIYKDYWYGERDSRTDLTLESDGFCKKIETGYKFTFAEKAIDVKFYEKLSHESFGKNSSSPGITGEFIKGQIVELWQGI